MNHALDIVWELTAANEKEKLAEKDRLLSRPETFRNPSEDNVEYIKIPGGAYNYSVTKELVTIPDLYSCKYPVTNKRYRRFIAYLAGKEKEFERKMPVGWFADKQVRFAVRSCRVVR